MKNRAKAIAQVSTQIIQNGVLALKAEQFKYEIGEEDAKAPNFLEG